MTKSATIAAMTIVMALADFPANGQPETAKSTFLPRFYSPQSVGIIPPESTTKCTGQPGTAVIVDIGDMLKSLNDNGKITRSIERKGGGPQKFVKYPSNIGTKNWPTNLDMQLAELKDPAKPNMGFKINNYVMVTVVLPKAQRNVQFMQPRDSTDPTDSTYAVTVEPNKVNRFCGRTPIQDYENDPKRNAVSFGVLSGATDPRAINIGIMIPDPTNRPVYWLPIIIDPIVENEG